jgi:methionyl-tRNA formyltransferase
MKIIYMGTPDFAIPPLEAILAAGHEVAAVVVQPDKQKGRGRAIKPAPVKAYALKQGLKVIQPANIKTAKTYATLETYGADIFVVAAYGQILPEKLLSLPRYGGINIHASLLPRYRGAAPIERAIIAGERETGVTIMQMDKGLDTGDILLSAAIPIKEKETSESLHDRLSGLGAELITAALTRIEKDDIIRIKQNEAYATYAPMLRRAEGLIDWEKPAEQIERMVRGFYGRIGSYTHYQNHKIKIWAADVETAHSKSGEIPGTIIKVGKNSITVACGKGSLVITELQLEGKKRMAAKEFLLGCKLYYGEVFHKGLNV